MNLFAPAFRKAQFDAIVCNGVLEHTGRPEAALRRLSPLLKPGGAMILTLPHARGRAWRKVVAAVTGDGQALASTKPGSKARETAVAIRNGHPHATTHTVAEARAWLAGAGLDLVRAIPSPSASMPKGGALFRPSTDGNGSALAGLAEHFGTDERFLVVGTRPSVAAATTGRGD